MAAALARNALLSFRRNKKHDCMLRCLLKCGRCGLGIHGCFYPGHGGRAGRRYYQCAGTDALTTAREAKCPRARIEAEPLEETVWTHVAGLLRDPAQLISLTEGGALPHDSAQAPARLRPGRSRPPRLVAEGRGGLARAPAVVPRRQAVRAVLRGARGRGGVGPGDALHLRPALRGRAPRGGHRTERSQVGRGARPGAASDRLWKARASCPPRACRARAVLRQVVPCAAPSAHPDRQPRGDPTRCTKRALSPETFHGVVDGSIGAVGPDAMAVG